jgi:UDP-N-acetylmuramate: L-alanyl-gamma-D-glutamyl-meso-diaminopimelate ligase
MATLAALLKRHGHEVSGSDEHVYPPMSDFLLSEGISLLEGYRAEHVAGALDLVVVGNAISRGNAELEAVLDRKLRYTSLPEAVREQFLWKSHAIVVAGTHGKTTTTAMAGWLLTHGGVDPTVLVGGIARNFGAGGSSYRVGEGRAFVIEGDEYDSAWFDKTAKFLKYLPDVAVVTNIEFDHADIYPDLDAVRLAFKRFVALVPGRGLTLIGADSPDAAALLPLARSRVQTFGLSDRAFWRAADITQVAGEAATAVVTRFRVIRDGTEVGEFSMGLVGEHNVRNALAAIAIGVEMGVAVDRLQDGLHGFLGVKRRLEVVGVERGITVYDDFAHHPTAVAETLRGVRRAMPRRRLWAVFEPRSASSCRRVFQRDFATALAGADRVVVASVFRSSLADDERLSEAALIADLQASGVNARHIPSVDEIVTTVAGEAEDGDLVVIMSNGGFGGIHRKLIEALGGRG